MGFLVRNHPPSCCCFAGVGVVVLHILLLNNVLIPSVHAHSNFPQFGAFSHNHNHSHSSEKLPPESNHHHHHVIASSKEAPLEYDQPTSPLVCYTCTNFDDCASTWRKVKDDPSNPSLPTETCSSPEERCVLHFSTKTGDPYPEDDNQVRLDLVGVIHLKVAGCEVPQNPEILDPSGCTTTPPEGGDHGTRTCYCNSTKCNTNLLKCTICGGYRKGGNCTHPNGNNYVMNYYEDGWVQAKSCDIGFNGGSQSFEAGLRLFRHPLNEESLLPSHCPPEDIQTQDISTLWENDSGGGTFPECTCSAKNCNKV